MCTHSTVCEHVSRGGEILTSASWVDIDDTAWHWNHNPHIFNLQEDRNAEYCMYICGTHYILSLRPFPPTKRKGGK